MSEFEELENTFKGTFVHAYRDEFANVYEAVHVKLNALDFLKEFEITDSEQVKSKAIELGIDIETIKESHLSKFKGCPKVYNLLIIKLFASKVKEASFDQIGKFLNEHDDEFKRITSELVSFRECNELATEIREGKCSISSEGKITCSEPLWNERVNDPKWLGYILFKPSQPYHSSYLRGLLAREQELRHAMIILSSYICSFTTLSLIILACTREDQLSVCIYRQKSLTLILLVLKMMVPDLMPNTSRVEQCDLTTVLN